MLDNNIIGINLEVFKQNMERKITTRSQETFSKLLRHLIDSNKPSNHFKFYCMISNWFSKQDQPQNTHNLSG